MYLTPCDPRRCLAQKASSTRRTLIQIGDRESNLSHAHSCNISRHPSTFSTSNLQPLQSSLSKRASIVGPHGQKHQGHEQNVPT